MQKMSGLACGHLGREAYLPDGEVNLITKGLLPGRGYFIALRFG